MSKLVFLKIGDGSFQTGFPIILQIGEEGFQPMVEIAGRLPSAIGVWESYQRWQASYRRLGYTYRLEAKEGYATNVSIIDDCNDLAVEFSDRLNRWVQSESFRSIRETLLAQLNRSDTIRFLVQTQNRQLRRLPWHLLDFFERYPQAEVALSSSSFEVGSQPTLSGSSIRVLAILGHAEGLNIEHDKAALNQLLHAEIHFLEEPSYSEFNEMLWDSNGWDILFFAGHSSSRDQPQPESLLSSLEKDGCISINPSESLSIDQLKYALRTARENGLSIAIFNSCDGLGLAQGLEDLQIPQILVMREPIPDQVAHKFLTSFLSAYANGKSFYLSVREARERLQGLERQFPCATWLPVICQNPTEIPPTWRSLYLRRNPPSEDVTHQEFDVRNRAIANLLTSLGIAALVIGIRLLGGFEALELRAYDRLLQLRPEEEPDNRIVIIETDSQDMEKSVTLSHQILNQLLEELEDYEPRLIGLDLYRNFSARSDHETLANRLNTTENLISICKGSDSPLDVAGTAPSPDIPEEQIGFSDFLLDPDDVLRRHLLVMDPEIDSDCQASYAFSTQLATRYLVEEGVIDNIWSDGGQLTLASKIFEPLNKNSGSYLTIDAEGYQLLLNYRQVTTPRQIAESIPLERVMNQELHSDALKDKIILIGRTDNDSGDLWVTPYSDPQDIGSMVPGVMMHAHMISQIISAVLDERPILSMWPEWQEFGWIVLWSVIGGGLSMIHHVKARNVKLVLGFLAAEASLCGICWLILAQAGIWIPFVPPAIALALSIIVAETYSNQFTRLSSHDWSSH